LDEAKTLSSYQEAAKLRNAGRCLCDAFKLFLTEVGGTIYGYNFVSSLSIKIRFKFIVQHLPELSSYSRLADELDTLRHRTEHSDFFFPAKEKIERLVGQADSVFKMKSSLVQKLQKQDALLDLEAQRRLLRLFLSWLGQDLDELQHSYDSFMGHAMPETEVVKRVKELVSVAGKIDEMDLISISDCLESARELVYEIGEESANLSGMMEEEAIMSSRPD
jgi:hypothetical protein